MADELRVLAAAGLALAVTLAVTPLVIRLALRTDFLDHPHSYKAHGRATPYLGGLAVMAGIAAAAAFFAGDLRDAVVGWLLVSVVAISALGTIDDRVSLGPGVRVLTVVGVAAGLWATGHGWTGLGPSGVELLLTVVWVLGVVNAFNLMDNMDGACTSVAAASGAGIGVLSLHLDQFGYAVVAFALSGACLGFLRYNLASPSRIFLGDGGSMALGLLVAGLSMGLSQAHGDPGWGFIVSSVTLVGLPALDTALVIVSRRRRGVAVLSGGRDHLTHRLLSALKRPWRVALAMGLAQFALALLAVALFNTHGAEVWALVGAYLFIAVAVIAFFERPAWRPPRPAAE